MEEKIIKPISKDKVNSVLVIKILDGHFTDDTWWNFSSTGQEFHHYDLLEAVGGKSMSCLEVNHNGRGWQDFILDSLPQKVRRKGPGSTKYVEVDYEIFIMTETEEIFQEEKKFINLVQKRFVKELNNSLRDSDKNVIVKNEIGREKSQH